MNPPGKGAEAQKSILAADRDMARAFVEKWRAASRGPAKRPTSDACCTSSSVKRWSTCACSSRRLGGRTDVLGRRADGAGTDGAVLPTGGSNSRRFCESLCLQRVPGVETDQKGRHRRRQQSRRSARGGRVCCRAARRHPHRRFPLRDRRNRARRGGPRRSAPLSQCRDRRRHGARAARDLLDALLAIENASAASGRPPARPHARSGSRCCSARKSVDEPGLQVPHPRFRERFFVLGPLAQVAPDLRDPVTGLRGRSCCGTC